MQTHTTALPGLPIPNSSESNNFAVEMDVKGVAHSSLHKLLDAVTDDRVLFYRGGSHMNPDSYAPLSVRFEEFARHEGKEKITLQQYQQFISDRFTPVCIMHDWDAALGEAIKKMPDDEWHIPFSRVCFEFETISRYPDKVVEKVKTFFLFHADDNDATKFHIIMVEGIDGVYLGEVIGCFNSNEISKYIERWSSTPTLTVGRCKAKCLSFIRAACIAIDAGIAESEDRPAPAKLQKARKARGKRPLPDVRIINLSLKYRLREYCKADVQAEADVRRVRLHLRRGHYWPRLGNEESRFAKFRKWRPWQLVGDPDLGYIEHHYRI